MMTDMSGMLAERDETIFVTNANLRLILVRYSSCAA